MTIYTLGTDRRSEEDFTEILHAYEIKALIDVRRYPQSRFEIFKRINLEHLMNQEQIQYHYMGGELGGFRKGGYIAYTLTDEFKKGVEILESIALQSRSVILCAEKFPWKCHRKWIARELQRKGWKVIHIIDKDKEWEPS